MDFIYYILLLFIILKALTFLYIIIINNLMQNINNKSSLKLSVIYTYIIGNN